MGDLGRGGGEGVGQVTELAFADSEAEEALEGVGVLGGGLEQRRAGRLRRSRPENAGRPLGHRKQICERVGSP